MQGIAVGDITGARHEYCYRKRPVEAHIIFYRENDREVVIVRVLHRRMDGGRHLPD